MRGRWMAASRTRRKFPFDPLKPDDLRAGGNFVLATRLGRLGGFWEISTASHIDWPQQSRVIDLVDNRDGNLSIFGTIVDHAAAPQPGGAPPGDGRGAAGEPPSRLASIARELSYNDPQANNGEDGRPDARGERSDRNAELVVRDPYGG